MSEPAERELSALREAVETLEGLCGRLADLLVAIGEGDQESGRLLSPAEVSRRWGVRRGWIYDHADELGARRLGEGTRPRLGFDPAELRERIGAPLGEGGRRLATIRGRGQSDSLPAPHEARFRGLRERGSGQRASAPGSAPSDGSSAR